MSRTARRTGLPAGTPLPAATIRKDDNLRPISGVGPFRVAPKTEG
jgi:predicted flap endonuclease-1-like 5' DNA nuclease